MINSANFGEELLTELWTKVYNSPQDIDVIDRLCTDDFILSNPNGDVVGRDNFKEWARTFISKIRDMSLKSLDMFSSAEHACRITLDCHRKTGDCRTNWKVCRLQ